MASRQCVAQYTLGVADVSDCFLGEVRALSQPKGGEDGGVDVRHHRARDGRERAQRVEGNEPVSNDGNQSDHEHLKVAEIELIRVVGGQVFYKTLAGHVLLGRRSALSDSVLNLGYGDTSCGCEAEGAEPGKQQKMFRDVDAHQPDPQAQAAQDEVRAVDHDHYAEPDDGLKFRVAVAAVPP